MCSSDLNFVGSRLEESANVIGFVDPAAYGQRHKNLFGGARYDVEDDAAVFMRCGNVQETELISTVAVIDARDLHRISGISQFDKFNALNNASGVNIETRNDSFRQHRAVILTEPKRVDKFATWPNNALTDSIRPNRLRVIGGTSGCSVDPSSELSEPRLFSFSSYINTDIGLYVGLKAGYNDHYRLIFSLFLPFIPKYFYVLVLL